MNIDRLHRINKLPFFVLIILLWLFSIPTVMFALYNYDNITFFFVIFYTFPLFIIIPSLFHYEVEFRIAISFIIIVFMILATIFFIIPNHTEYKKVAKKIFTIFHSLSDTTITEIKIGKGLSNNSRKISIKNPKLINKIQKSLKSCKQIDTCNSREENYYTITFINKEIKFTLLFKTTTNSNDISGSNILLLIMNQNIDAFDEKPFNDNSCCKAYYCNELQNIIEQDIDKNDSKQLK